MAKKNESGDRGIEVDMGIVSLGGIFNLVNKIVELGINLKDLESKLQKYKSEGKIRSDVNIRIGSLLDDKKEIRIGSGTFFKHLDELAKERRDVATSTQRRRINISSKDLVKTELAADLVEKEDRVYVLTQVPYEKSEIKVRVNKHGDTGDLIIEAPEHGYKRLIPINANVDLPDNGEVQWSYKNHVVEAILPKPKASERNNQH